MSNFLLTSIGSFSGKESIRRLKEKGNFIVGIDINEEKNISESVDIDIFYTCPYITEKEKYTSFITNIIQKHNVDFIIPLTDLDVDFFSEFFTNKSIICLSSKKTIDVCRDKLNFYELLKNSKSFNLIPTEIYNSKKSYQYPIIIKKRRGRSSEGLIKAFSSYDYNPDNPELKNYIVQPYIEGAIITCDLIRDKNNGIIYCFSRTENIRTKNGAGISVTGFFDPVLNKVCSDLACVLDIKGAVCVEFIKKDNIYYLMDINPRFSAGIAFTNLFGYDIVTNHIKCFTGEKIEENINYRYLTIVKNYHEIITNEETPNK
jgi:carbamoyl-phosphate synthase large subunit